MEPPTAIPIPDDLDEDQTDLLQRLRAGEFWAIGPLTSITPRCLHSPVVKPAMRGHGTSQRQLAALQNGTLFRNSRPMLRSLLKKQVEIAS